MAAPELPLTATRVAHSFHRDQVYLFLGAACITFGLIPVVIAVVRRRFDSLTRWLSLFAILYGLRLWMNHQLLDILPHHSLLFVRIRSAIAFLVPVPAFFFFQKSRLLGTPGKLVTRLVSPLLVLLAILAIFGASQFVLIAINNVIIIAALCVLSAVVFSRREVSGDLTIIRRGLFIFLAAALFDNISSFFDRYYLVEPFAFIVFLFCLGLVAARQSLAQETQLTLVHQELDIARSIQLSILPPPFPASTSFAVAARYLPMTTIAGDFYDFLLTGTHDHQQAAILIADVSGHGIPAALIASMVKLAAVSNRALAPDPAALLHAMNTALCGNTQSQFVTAACVYLDAASRQLHYAAAAHPPMLLLRAGNVTPILENGLMLAVFPTATYTSLVHDLQPGDRLVLYTDGLLEAANTDLDEFGAARLADLVRASANQPSAEAADHIIERIRQWSPVATDDLTVIVCDCLA